MVNRCLNPDCRMEFRLLNAGDLYAYESRRSDTEFFWLCSTCASRLELYVDALGSVSVRARNAVERMPPPHPDGGLRLVSRSSRPLPRPETVPAGERKPPLPVGHGPFYSPFHVRGAVHR